MSLSPLLRNLEVFSRLGDEAVEALAPFTRRRSFRAGEALFFEGDPGHCLYVILAGRVNIRRITPSGETIHLAHRGPGEFIGEMALIDGKARMADAVVAEPADLLMIDGGAFLHCMDTAPEVARRVMACITERLREAARRLETEHSQDVLGRLATTVLDLMEAHGADPVPGGSRIRVTMSQQELAEHVHTTRESVNRALSELRQVKAIRYEARQFVVLDPEKLRQYSRR